MGLIRKSAGKYIYFKDILDAPRKMWQECLLATPKKIESKMDLLYKTPFGNIFFN